MNKTTQYDLGTHSVLSKFRLKGGQGTSVDDTRFPIKKIVSGIIQNGATSQAFLLEDNKEIQNKVKLIYEEFKYVDTNNTLFMLLSNCLQSSVESYGLYMYGNTKSDVYKVYSDLNTAINSIYNSLIVYSLTNEEKLLIVEQLEELMSSNYVKSLNNFLDVLKTVGNKSYRL